MSFKKWNDGQKSEEVQSIIENNFNVLYKDREKNIKALTTIERRSLSSNEVSNGLIVFDKDLGIWYEYQNGTWITKPLRGSSNKYIRDIEISDWDNGIISIPFDIHAIPSPTVQLFMHNGIKYELTYGGVTISENDDVTLSSDLSFNGKVVIQ